MKIRTLQSFRRSIFCAGWFLSAPAFAVCDGCVVNAVQLVNASVNTMHTSLSQLLYNLGLATNQNGAKIASTIETASNSQREFSIVQEKSRRLEDARQRYQVPATICSESGSGGVIAIHAATNATQSKMHPGGGLTINNASIAQAINSPPVSPEIDAARAAKIHAQFCDADDYAAYGGSRACPSISTTMPGADKRIHTILSGAGSNGKTPEMTFSQAQTDVARLYAHNTIRRSIAPQLKKGEASTAAGAQYVGLMNQYNAVLSAAADPQEQRIAESQPNSATKSLIKEMLNTSSVASYYQQVASSQAKSTGAMSAREFEAFEVGRRYANTEYQSDLQSMSGDNLVREQIRVTALNAWLLLKLKDEIQLGNILQGQLLASAARQEYAPILAQKYRVVQGGMGGQ
jgi:hypothetical protein